MLSKDKGNDILQSIGGIETKEEADNLIAEKLDKVHAQRMEKINDTGVRLKIANAINLCLPDTVYVNTGSEEDQSFIRNLSLSNGEEQALPLQGHSIHFDLKEEQGRIIDRTYYIINPDERISSLANQMQREQALQEIQENMHGIMQGKTMLIGFYSRGPIGSPASNPAIEITSSAYVAHSAEILYRNAYAAFDAEVNRVGYFFSNIHSQGLNRPQDLPMARVFMDRSHWTTYSFNCTYAGNTLLLKKGNHRFAVDRTVYSRRGQELSEHMFITGIKGPAGRITWIAGAAPSGCGKTTTAMAGDFFVGDDLAQMWIGADGSVRAVNPEKGIFGIVEDVNWEGDPVLMQVLRNPGHEVIWSNVLIDDQGRPRWSGDGEPPPRKGTNFQGPWEPGMTDEQGRPVPMSHPNSRCTIHSRSLANYSERAEDVDGVETRVITYSGRDSDTMPPVWVAKDAAEGVVIGACIVSAATATEVGAQGVKRAPWANAPFIPGALGDYMDAQFRFFGNKKIAARKAPIIAGLNYFLTHAARQGKGSGLLGEKKDVKVWLAWLERMAHGAIEYIDSPIGYLPRYKDLKIMFAQIIDKEYPEELYIKQFSIYVDKIMARIDLQEKAYRREENVPQRLFDILQKHKKNLLALKKEYGSVLTPQQLQENSSVNC